MAAEVRAPGRLGAHLRVIATIALLALVGGCSDTADSQDQPTGRSTVSPAVEQEIRAAVDRLNSTAGGPVPAQQELLATLVDPALVDALDHCPPASHTLHLEPVYAALRPASEWTSPRGTPTGDVYALPTLIRSYSGERMTGTDVATLHVGVHSGSVGFAPICVA